LDHFGTLDFQIPGSTVGLTGRVIFQDNDPKFSWYAYHIPLVQYHSREFAFGARVAIPTRRQIWDLPGWIISV